MKQLTDPRALRVVGAGALFFTSAICDQGPHTFIRSPDIGLWKMQNRLNVANGSARKPALIHCIKNFTVGNKCKARHFKIVSIVYTRSGSVYASPGDMRAGATAQEERTGDMIAGRRGIYAVKGQHPATTS
jgi:hypothetical protein